MAVSFIAELTEAMKEEELDMLRDRERTVARTFAPHAVKFRANDTMFRACLGEKQLGKPAKIAGAGRLSIKQGRGQILASRLPRNLDASGGLPR